MQSGDFLGGDVTELKSRVLVNGVERRHVSWSTDRELSGDLPVQVTAMSGITQATGTVVWAEVSDVLDKPNNPWDSNTGWIPSRGDRVDIYAGDGTNEYKQFTGIIDKTTGSIGEGFQSTIIDDYDQLSKLVTQEPLLNKMPPVTAGDPFLGVGLVYTYYVDKAMRSSGFFTTPSREPNSVAYIPCQGGMWPHLGVVTTARTISGASYPSNYFSPWGFAVGDFVMLLNPVSPQSISAPVQLTMVVAPSSNGYAIVRAQYGASYVELYVDASWNVHARLNGSSVASFAMSGKGGSDNRVVQMLVKGGVFTVRSSNGQSATGSASFSGSTLMSAVRLDGSTSARVSGMQVSHPTEAYEFRDLSFKPSAIINVANTTFMDVPNVLPPVDKQPAVDLLSEISEATLSPMWINELGVLQFWPALSLRGRASRQTLSTLNDILDLQWEDSILGSRSLVVTKYEEPALKFSLFRNIQLSVGSGGTMGSSEVSEDFINIPDNEVWVGVDDNPVTLRTSNWALYNKPERSFVGGFFSSSGSATSETGLSYSQNFSKVNLTTYKLTQTVGALPADVEFNTSTSPTATALWENKRNKPLWDIRGHAKAEYADREYTSTVPGGTGPTLVHDGGKWVTSNTAVAISDFLATETAVPKPVITGLEVTYDPRRQLGDVVTIESNKFMGVSMEALIVGVSNSAGSDGFTQSLSVRIISVTKNGLTYAQYNNLLTQSNLTYAQWQALGPVPQTYGQFNDA